MFKMWTAILLLGSLTFSAMAFAFCAPQVTDISSAITADIKSIHGSGSEIWAVGPKTVLRWDGSRFVPPIVDLPEFDPSPANGAKSSCPERNFRGVWVNSPDNVWVGCDTETDNTGIAHWNGINWHYFELHANRKVNSLWSGRSGDLWAVGGKAGDSSNTDFSGYAGHYSAKDKQWQKVGYDLQATGIWVTAERNIWTLCNDKEICLDKKAKILNAPATTDPDDPEYGIILNTLGSKAQYSGKTILRGIWAGNSKNLWVVGDMGTVLHSRDGKSWKTEGKGVGPVDLTSVSGAENSVWAVGRGGAIEYFDGKRWRHVASGVSEDLRSVWVSPLGEAFVVGDNGTLLHVGLRCGVSQGPPNCGPHTPPAQSLGKAMQKGLLQNN